MQRETNEFWKMTFEDSTGEFRVPHRRQRSVYVTPVPVGTIGVVRDREVL